MSASKGVEEVAGRSLREIVQKKFLEEVIGFGGNWKALVMDRVSTKVMSSACTMFDIMEKRVTIVENLSNKRQPFPEMDVVYFITPTDASIRLMLADFENAKKPMYGNVHVIFTDTISNECMATIQTHGNFVARIKTFKEINVDFHVVEGSLYSMEMPETLTKVYGSVPDPTLANIIGKKLANVCISLNEQPTIRYQGNSNFCRDIANSMNTTIQAYKRANTSFFCYGDDAKQDRERGTLLLLDRSFDPATPLMHEYTYQALVYDLLHVENNLLKYKASTGKGEVEKEALLGEQDEVWVELRNSHILKVIQVISDKMKDILANSAGAKLGKDKDKMEVAEMAAAVKQLPEYQQTMSRWGAHTAIASMCMKEFSNPKDNIFELSNVEQMATMGSFYDNEEGELKNLKPNEVFQKILAYLPTMPNKALKIRLVAIWWIAQKSATEDQRRQLIQAAGITGAEQQLFLNFAKLALNSSSLTAAPVASASKGSTSVFSSFFGGGDSKSKSSASGGGSGGEDQVPSRHIPQLKTILEQLQSGDLSVAQFPSAGPQAPAKDTKSAAKSVRKFGTNNRWGTKADVGFDGGRVIVFIAGGVSYPEIRTAHEISIAQRKEVIIGSTNIVNPANYIELISNLSASTAAAPPRP